MATVPTTGAAQVAAVPIQQGMQIMNVRPSQGNLLQPQQVRSLAPRMILSPQVIQNVRPGQPGVRYLVILLLRLQYLTLLHQDLWSIC